MRERFGLRLWVLMAGFALATPWLAQGAEPATPAGALVTEAVGLTPEAVALAPEAVVPARLVGADLFKNGLAVIRQELAVPGPGCYLVAEVPAAAHGTFWVESAAAVSLRRVTREAMVPGFASLGGSGGAAAADFQRLLAGRQVTVVLQGEDVAPVCGRVASPAAAPARPAWNREYQQSGAAWGWSGFDPRRHEPVGGAARFLVLETASGTTWLDASQILTLHSEGGPLPARETRPALLLEVRSAPAFPATVGFSYLTRGLSWAPSYRLDLAAADRLELRQSAVIRNELAPLAAVPVNLITGFPSMAFAHVDSPLSAQATWAGFFSQLQNPPGSGYGRHGRGSEMMQQAVMSNNDLVGPGGELGAIPSGEGVDLHFQPIGPLTLGEGEAVTLEVASGSAAYERVVEWRVPDLRDAEGRPGRSGRGGDGESDEADRPWDALRFKNPLPFPLTTGSALVVAGERFCGQQMLTFTSPGEEASLRVTRALHLRTRASEQEVPDERAVVSLGGHSYRRVRVKGELLVNNHRREAVTLLLRRCFSGELIESSGQPACSLREEGVWSVNPRHELRWTARLEAGKEATFTYLYEVLVRD